MYQLCELAETVNNIGKTDLIDYKKLSKREGKYEICIASYFNQVIAVLPEHSGS